MKQLRFVRLALCLGVIFSSIGEASALDVTLSGDAHVNSAHADINYGTLSNLYVGNGATTFLQFDLSTLPAGTTSAQVSRATLTVFVNRVNTAGSVTVSPVTETWGEYSVTAATAPTTGSPIATFPISVAGQFVSVDVTAQVQSWLGTPGSNNGLALTSGSVYVLFDSKENDETGHSARLDVTLVSQGPQGIQGPAGPMGSTGPAGLQGIQGLQGLQGPIGPAGLTGATGAAGPAGAGVVYQGAFSSGTVYAVNDAVTLNGSTYISLQASNVGHIPDTNPTFWAVFAAAGAVGSVGPQGIQGIPGPIGPMGIQGLQGPVGPAGPIGATGATGPIGATGATGSTGVQGPAGPTGPTGTFSYESNYSSSTAYTLGQVIFCSTTCSTNGSSYISLVNGSNQGFDPPTSNVKWGLIARAGATGATGPTGATGATGPSGPTGPTGATGPAGPAGSGGGLQLKDKNGVSQGYLLGYDGYFDFTVEHSGYIYQVGYDGTFWGAQIYWTGANCTGTPYLNDSYSGGVQGVANQLTYSAKTNTLYTLANPNASGVSTSVVITAASIENPTCYNYTPGISVGGWALTATTPAAIGSTATGTPLKVPAPFQLP